MLVTVARTEMAPEAHILRGRLEAEGIPAFVQHEHHVTMDWFLSNALGGVRLQVPVEHAQAAIEIMQQWQRGEFTLDAVTVESTPASTDSQTGPTADAMPHCPSCGTVAKRDRPSPRGLALAFLYLLALPIPWRRDYWHCASCDHRWSGRSTTPHGVGTGLLGSLLILAAAFVLLTLIGIAISGLCRNTRICPSPERQAVRAPAASPDQTGTTYVVHFAQRAV